jgi:hypothetical protein
MIFLILIAVYAMLILFCGGSSTYTSRMEALEKRIKQLEDKEK